MTYEKFVEAAEDRNPKITRAKIGKFAVKFTLLFVSVSIVLAQVCYYTLPAFFVFVVLILLLVLYVELFTIMAESEKLFKILYAIARVWFLFTIAATVGVVFILTILG